MVISLRFREYRGFMFNISGLHVFSTKLSNILRKLRLAINFISSFKTHKVRALNRIAIYKDFF